MGWEGQRGGHGQCIVHGVGGGERGDVGTWQEEGTGIKGADVSNRCARGEARGGGVGRGCTWASGVTGKGVCGLTAPVCEVGRSRRQLCALVRVARGWFGRWSVATAGLGRGKVYGISGMGVVGTRRRWKLRGEWE